jgi:lysyl-tRNA synthetase class 2
MRDYSELEKVRLQKLERLRAAGMEPYPGRAERTHTSEAALAAYAAHLSANRRPIPTRLLGGLWSPGACAPSE